MSSPNWTTEWTLPHRKGNSELILEVWREENRTALVRNKLLGFPEVFPSSCEGDLPLLLCDSEPFLSFYRFRGQKAESAAAAQLRAFPACFFGLFGHLGTPISLHLPDAKMRGLGHTKADKVTDTEGEISTECVLDSCSLCP